MAANRERSDEEKRERNERIRKEGKRLYLKEFERQLSRLEALVQDPQGDLAGAQEIYKLLHTIKGSAPVFGFTQAGNIAAAWIVPWEWAAANEPNDGAVPPDRTELLAESAEFARRLRMEFEIGQQEIKLEDTPSGTAELSVPSSRLLVIDDDDTLRSYMMRRLELDGYKVDGAAAVAEAQKLLRQNKYDLITLDLVMYPQSGYELFQFLKDDPTLKWLPLIVLSGRNDLQDKVRSFQLGADDYVTKPFEYLELSARIYSLLKRTKNFEQMAFRDPLTGVYNRRYFNNLIQDEIRRAQRSLEPLSLVFVDIDRFKRINDTYGHHIGDLVLQGMAHFLQQNLRSSDFLARFGGEEFVAILPDTPKEEALARFHAILETARHQAIAQNEGELFHITFSAGIAEWSSELTQEQWIQMADEAMYSAKQQGRNRVVLAGSGPAPMEEAAADRKSVLIADDDEFLRSILASKLQGLNVEILEAANGEEAYGILQKRQVDLCILDGIMPKLDGYELLKKLKDESVSSSPRMKTLMLSGRNNEADVVRGLTLGANDYMAKPFSVVELEIRAKRLLEID